MLFFVVTVVKDCATGWSKSFGFVRYSTIEGVVGIESMVGKVNYVHC